MSIKRTISVVVVLVMLAALLAGCGTANQASNEAAKPADQAANESGKVAIILKTLANPFWVSMKEGIEAEAKAQGITVDIFAVASEDDVQGQLKLFEDILNKDYQAVGIAPLSPVNAIPAIAAANKKGIYVVNIDEKVDMNELKNAGGSVLAFVTTDNKKVGAKGAGYIVEQLGAEGGEVAIIEGKAGNASGEDRKQGAAEAFGANAAIKLVASQPADWDRIKALDVTTNLIQRYPNLKAIYSANDTMALGALQAVENTGKKIIVVGTDGAPEAVQSVRDGKVAATVAQDPAQIGATSLKILIDAMKNKTQSAQGADIQMTAVDSNLITK